MNSTDFVSHAEFDVIAHDDRSADTHCSASCKKNSTKHIQKGTRRKLIRMSESHRECRQKAREGERKRERETETETELLSARTKTDNCLVDAVHRAPGAPRRQIGKRHVTQLSHCLKGRLLVGGESLLSYATCALLSVTQNKNTT